jgi:hypothetical protein
VMINKFDLNGDGVLSFEEFMVMMKWCSYVLYYCITCKPIVSFMGFFMSCTL